MSQTMSINIDELKAYKIAFDMFADRWDSFIEQYLLNMANQVMAQAMARSPVDTGNLRRSWKVSEVEVGSKYVTIYITNDASSDPTGESYASHVEYGHFNVTRTKFIEGVHMLQISLEEVQKQAQWEFDKLIVKWAMEAGL